MQTSVAIHPITQFPDGETIPPELSLMQGRALTKWEAGVDLALGDEGQIAGAVPVGGGVGGLLELVYAGKHSEGRFDARLVDAAAELIRRDWKPSPPPEWVTYIRSLRCPFLMPDYAERLASVLGLPCLDAVAATRETEPQKTMPDAHRRYENVVGLFDVLPSVRPEPVLLLDDIVSSRWTLTSAGMALRKAGVAAVHPFVLADFSEMAGACRSAAE